MFGNQLLEGLKHFYKEEQLSDRILRIVEINESFRSGEKRPHSDNNQPIQRASKRLRSSLDSGFGDDCEELGDSMLASNETLNQQVNNLPNNISSIDHVEGSDQAGTSACVANVGGINEDEIEKCYSVFPIHSIVFSLSSMYFKKLLLESGMKETSMKTVTVKVNYGEGKYLEKLVEGFYNQDILRDISLADLLCVLDIAARFSCTNFLKYGIGLLNTKEVNSIQECDSVLKHISRVFQVFDEENKYDTIKKKCLKFLSEAFYPLELRPDQYEVFKQLHHLTVMFLLASDYAFTTNESNTFVLVYLWLIHHQDTITPSVIDSLVSAIQYELLSVSILVDQLKPNDSVLSRWSGYTNWHLRALKYHLLTKHQRDIRGMESFSPSVRNIPSRESYIMKHFVFDQEHRSFCDRSKNCLVWDGFQLCPVISLRQIGSEQFLRLKIIAMNTFLPGVDFENFHLKFDIYFCILPGNISIKPIFLQTKQILLQYFRKGVVEFKKSGLHSFRNVAKIHESFLSSVENYGVNLVLFFKRNLSSWNQFESYNVRGTKKVIKLRQDSLLSTLHNRPSS